MNIGKAFPFTLIVELVGALVFLWIFYRLLVNHAAATSFWRRNLWKLVLVGFCMIAFWGINSAMFHLEAREDEAFDKVLTDFNMVRDQIEIVGIEGGDSHRITYARDGKTVFIRVRDPVAKETAPCYIKAEKVYIFLKDSVSKPFIRFNSTENTIDLYFPEDAVEIVSERIERDALDVKQVKSESLKIFLASLDVLEE